MLLVKLIYIRVGPVEFRYTRGVVRIPTNLQTLLDERSIPHKVTAVSRCFSVLKQQQQQQQQQNILYFQLIPLPPFFLLSF